MELIEIRPCSKSMANPRSVESISADNVIAFDRCFDYLIDQL